MCKWRSHRCARSWIQDHKKAMDKSKKPGKNNKTIGSELDRVKNDNALVTTEVT